MKTILIADDSPDIRRLLRVTLTAGLAERPTIVEAADGLELLELARSSRPHLIILAEAMPRLDGTVVCEKLRQRPPMDDVKIVLLISGRSIEDHLPIDASFRKPFSPTELLQTVEQLLAPGEATSRPVAPLPA